jgi:hypothetical protein
MGRAQLLDHQARRARRRALDARHVDALAAQRSQDLVAERIGADARDIAGAQAQAGQADRDVSLGPPDELRQARRRRQATRRRQADQRLADREQIERPACRCGRRPGGRRRRRLKSQPCCGHCVPLPLAARLPNRFAAAGVRDHRSAPAVKLPRHGSRRPARAGRPGARPVAPASCGSPAPSARTPSVDDVTAALQRAGLPRAAQGQRSDQSVQNVIPFQRGVVPIGHFDRAGPLHRALGVDADAGERDDLATQGRRSSCAPSDGRRPAALPSARRAGVRPRPCR